MASGEGSGWYAIQATNPLVSAQGVAHDRTLIYRPGSALIVADRLRSGQNHSYRSYFQYGPDFGLQRTGDDTRLFAGADQVDVSHRSTDPSLGIQAVRGQDDPLLGFVYPGFRDREPRWTETVVAEGSDVDNVTTLSVDRKRRIEATALAPLGDTSTFAITEDGEPASTLTVTRRGDGLTVVETPAVP